MLLYNDFHHTTVQVNLRGSRRLSRYQVMAAWKRLCGIPTCHCGGVAGQRGPQWLEGQRVSILPEPDGTASIEVN